MANRKAAAIAVETSGIGADAGAGSPGETTATLAPPPSASSQPDDVAGRFLGQWNRLISTTNWEKGRIICQWREALALAGAAITAYSDEAWAQLVGGVTSQHVGRLRRVYQRFGAVTDQYEGLYWSHFQAGLDWDDAEMWLEGAILNGWSVSQMRGKRWETLGNPGDAPADGADAAAADEALGEELGSEEASAGAPASPSGAPAESAPWEAGDDDSEAAADDDESERSADYDPIPAATAPAKTRSRLGVNVDDLPEDLADAFEQFKLAIIAQRRLSWSETSPSAVIECLDALKELVLAPTDA